MADSRLQEQLDNLQNIDAVQAMLPAAYILRDAAIEIVPVDTGSLKASIIADELPSDGAFVSAGGEGFLTPKGGPVDYATFVEYGNNNPNYPIQPYMRPALDNNEDEMRDAISKNIQSQMESLIR